ncbi:hypothetical protein RUM44_001723 [Polyplax serrata]|uniref:protein-lysine 6-oxidase n=1 Tax=Polyplax serrata TaxID=468196 RepID=A0ABR1AKW8_POLSC
MNKKYLMFFVFLVFVNVSVVGGSSPEKYRERKKTLIKKYMRKVKRPEGIIRLVNGRGPFEGNVEIHHMGKWGSICDDEWDEKEANIVCRYLGYEKAIKPTHDSMFGSSRKRFWMDNLYCDGTEKSLSDCRFDGWGNSDCTENEAAGVVCDTPEAHIKEPTFVKPPKTKIKDKAKNDQPIQVRLRGGRIPQEGRVEIKVGNSDWGLICGDGWSLLEGNVVCKQLNLGYASDAVHTDFFGGGNSSMLLSGVQCRGNETGLQHCLHDDLGKIECPGKKGHYAGVVCSSQMADLVIDFEEIMRSIHLEDRQLYFLQCAMEENCVASQAYRIQKEDTHGWHLETRRLLRFTARIPNVGTADFRPFIPKHLWEWHSCHMHYHSMEVFATFDIMAKNGTKVAEGHKASFCLEDNQCLPGVEPRFACANYGDQGISVNCSDIYRYNIDCQWIDITELDPGVYQFKVSINPEFKVAEMNFENNAALCTLYYTETFAYVNNCSLVKP